MSNTKSFVYTGDLVDLSMLIFLHLSQSGLGSSLLSFSGCLHALVSCMNISSLNMFFLLGPRILRNGTRQL